MTKALIVKEDGLIYAAEVPEEPSHGKVRYYERREQHLKALASAKESAVLVSDQEKARTIIQQLQGTPFIPTDKIYPIPDLQWEVDDSHNPEKQGYTYGGGYAADMMAYNGPVAILKESTPYNQNLKEVSKGELLNIIKEKCDQLEQEDKSRRLAANPEAVFVRAEESTPSTEKDECGRPLTYWGGKAEPSKEETKLQSEQKTLQQCKDQIAKKHGYKDYHACNCNCNASDLMQEAAELYASQFKSQLPIEQKNELELIIAEKNNYDFDQWLATRKGSKPR